MHEGDEVYIWRLEESTVWRYLCWELSLVNQVAEDCQLNEKHSYWKRVQKNIEDVHQNIANFDFEKYWVLFIVVYLNIYCHFFCNSTLLLLAFSQFIPKNTRFLLEYWYASAKIRPFLTRNNELAIGNLNSLIYLFHNCLSINIFISFCSTDNRV